MTDQAAADLISVPQGGGAISGIGETFQPDLHTGTGNLSIPLQLPAGRNGLQPSLSLSYSTGNPNGPFGLGWSLPVPGVRRKTDKGIPRYDPSLDTFVLSGAEDLVPVTDVRSPAVRYRPRSEAGYAKITHLTGASGDYWEVWSTDGLRSRYGTPQQQLPPGGADLAIIADPDPAHRDRIFAWLLTETVDPLGNKIFYTYQDDQAGTAQRYLSQISYADYGEAATPQYLVTVKFILDPQPRPDPFSDHRPGFELGTTQRIATIETWTNAATPVLARRVELSYADQPGTSPANPVSLLTQVSVTGVDGDSTQALPPLEFRYTDWEPDQRRYQQITAPLGQLPPVSLASPGFDLVDLFGDGLTSILQLNGAARYWRNRGNGEFDPPHSIPFVPTGASLGTPGVQLADINGDGRPDLLLSSPTSTSYWSLASDGGFAPDSYARASTAPTFSLSDPLVRLVDLDGDGVMDVLRTGDRFELFYNDGNADFTSLQVLDRGTVPDISFADPRVRLADMTGDGLTDIVLLHNHYVMYWPYQGYGKWAAQVVMKGAPSFEDGLEYDLTGFDPQRLLLGDVDGDGCADLIYVGDGHVTVWVNQTGNAFAPPTVIPGTPRAAGASIRLIDMDGTGTAGILWSYDLGSVRGSSYKFLDLTGGVKPYLLSQINNHAGAATTITYASSTAYATADRAAGHPWHTTLPFPVQVVANTTVTDYFSQNTLTSEYFYHHGYWDGADREFRGFARVDQRDTLTPTGPAPDYYSPPTETRTWFHLGPVGSESRWTSGLDLSTDYWAGDQILTPHVDDSALTALNLPNRQMRYAARALRGRVLRSELYALDGDPNAGSPYQITDHAYTLAFIQNSDPSWQPTSPVVAVQPVLDRSSVWERGTDPMTRATVTGGYDSYGRPHQTIQIAVPRGRNPHLTSPGASPYLATTTLIDYATRDDDTHYLINRVSSQQRLKLTEDTTAGLRLIDYALQQLADPATSAAENIRALTLTYYDGQAFEGMPNGQVGDWGLRTRVESLALTPGILADAYQGGDPSIPLPPYLEPGTPVWTSDYPQAFRDLTVPLAGYQYQTDQALYLAGWYSQQERVCYDIQQNGTGRGLVTARLDPLGNKTTITYDDPYQLLPTTVTDPASLTQSATYDYRVLRPSLVTDPNGNQIVISYTPLGLPAWLAATGKPGANQGDTPDQPGTVFTYDLTAWDDNPSNLQPISVHTTRRVDHRWTLINEVNAQRVQQGLPPLTDAQIAAMFPPDEASQYPDRFIQKTEFTDGFGRLLQTRAQGDDTILDDLGLTADMDTQPGPVVTHQQDPAAPPQVVVSGWQTCDNKGRVVEKYEPFFDTGWAYQPPTAAQLAGQLAKVVTVYDPRGLAIRTTFPDGSEQRLVPGIPPDLTNPDQYTPTAWETYCYDQNDNAGRTDPTDSAAWSTHWNTPSSDLLDPLGRVTEHTKRTATTSLTATNVYDIDGNLLQVTDPLSRTASQQVYDLQGRSWRQQLIDAGTTRVVLDAAGGTVERRDGKGALKLAVADSLRRPLRTWCRDRATDTPTLRAAVVYGDDQAETGLQPGDAAAVNLLGRPYHTYDEAGRVETTNYDLDGNLLEKTRRTLSTQALMSALPGPAGDWANAYYQADWQPAPGQTLAQHAGPLLDPTAYTISTSYDALARPAAITAPLDADGIRKTLNPTYSRAGTLTALDLDGDNYVQQILYNARGQRALAILGCATMIRYAYDPQTFRLTRLRSEPTPASPPSPVPPPPLEDYGYAYDLVGNITTIDERVPGCGISANPEAAGQQDPILRQLLAAGDALLRHFGYDPLYRLTSATGRECDIPPLTPWLDVPRCIDLTKVRGYTETYTYDDIGGLLNLAHQAATGSFTRTYSVPPGSNQAVTMTTGQTAYQYGYDASGNMVSEATNRLFEWNHANQLATFRDQTSNAEPTVYTQYRYDNAGQRVLKIVRKHSDPLAVTTYIGGLFERIALTDATGATTSHDTLQILDAAGRIAAAHAGPPLPGDPSPVIAYHLGDHLGSSTIVLDSSGVLYNREEYTPYGDTSFGSYSKKRYRFTAKERDEESGLYYHGARYYAPWLARWASPDPSGLRDGLNLYSYVHANPVRNSDPTGLQADAGQDTASTQPQLDAVSAGMADAGYIPPPPEPIPDARPPFPPVPEDPEPNWPPWMTRYQTKNVKDAHEANVLRLHAERRAAGLDTLTGGPVIPPERISLFDRIMFAGARYVGKPVLTGILTCPLLMEEGIMFVVSEGVGEAGYSSVMASAARSELLNSSADFALEQGGVRFGPANSGLLHVPDLKGEAIADSFRSSSYTGRLLQKDTTFYRVFGGPKGKPYSIFWTTSPSAGPLESQLGNALLIDQWGVLPKYESTINVPAGTLIYEGVVGEQFLTTGKEFTGVLPGGNPQYVLLSPPD